MGIVGQEDTESSPNHPTKRARHMDGMKVEASKSSGARSKAKRNKAEGEKVATGLVAGGHTDNSGNENDKRRRK